jgi:hypothetical protein
MSIIRLAILLTLAASPLQSQRPEPDRITRSEIAASPQRGGDAYAAIRALRPLYFTPPAGREPVQLYIDGRRQENLEPLRALPASQVEEVRYLDPTKSQTEFGARGNGGTIVVKKVRLRIQKDS